MSDGSDASPDELLHAGFRYALSLAHDRAEAEDLLQDGWVSLLRAGGPRTRAYLMRAIRSRYVDRYRRSRAVLVEPVPADEVEALAVDWKAAGATLLAADHDTLGDALARLRPEEREAVFLQVVEGYSASEIAELTQTPRGTVLSLVHRAKKKLSRWLERKEASA